MTERACNWCEGGAPTMSLCGGPTWRMTARCGFTGIASPSGSMCKQVWQSLTLEQLEELREWNDKR